MEAVIFIGHGIRSEAGNEKVASFMKDTIDKVSVLVKAYCFFERAEPTIIQAFESCVQKGATKFIVVPVFLLPGIEVNTGIPKELSIVKEVFPQIEIYYQKPIGIDKQVIELLEERLDEKGYTNQSEDAIFLIGHGSQDPTAGKELTGVAEALSRKLGNAVYTGYLQTEPNFIHQIEKVMATKQRVYLIPYFLNVGYFVAKIEEKVHSYFDGEIKPEIIFCNPIGLDERISSILLERVVERKTY